MIECWMHFKRKDKEKGEQHNPLYNSDEGVTMKLLEWVSIQLEKVLDIVKIYVKKEN